MVQHLHALPSSRARETGDSSAPPIPGEGITSQLCNPCDVMVFNPFPDPGNPHGRPLARRGRPDGAAGPGGVARRAATFDGVPASRRGVRAVHPPC